MPVCRAQLPLELESVHASHAHIENQACRLGCALRLQECFRRRKTFYPKADGSDQIVERISQRVIIVDNRNERNSGHTAISPPFLSVSARKSSHAPERNTQNTQTLAGEDREQTMVRVSGHQ